MNQLQPGLLVVAELGAVIDPYDKGQFLFHGRVVEGRSELANMVKCAAREHYCNHQQQKPDENLEPVVTV
jgi:hypothetical protein